MKKQEARAEEMKRLRFEEYWTLQMIAERFHVTRQRVQQIIGPTGSGFRSKLNRRLVSSPDKTRRQS